MRADTTVGHAPHALGWAELRHRTRFAPSSTGLELGKHFDRAFAIGSLSAPTFFDH